MTTRTTKTETSNACIAYEQSHDEAVHLVEQIRDALYDLPAPDGEIPINWGHVGSLNEVANRLRATLAFLNGTEV
jgi:hypothetical protein